MTQEQFEKAIEIHGELTDYKRGFIPDYAKVAENLSEISINTYEGFGRILFDFTTGSRHDELKVFLKEYLLRLESEKQNKIAELEKQFAAL